MKKITLVEDDSSIIEMYRYKLEEAGYSVSIAQDGKEALDVIDQNRPELILLDIKMPKLPGNEVLKWLRSQDWGTEIKVIVLTNISKSEAPSDFRMLNVSEYIVKAHYTPDQVLEIVNQVILK